MHTRSTGPGPSEAATLLMTADGKSPVLERVFQDSQTVSLDPLIGSKRNQRAVSSGSDRWSKSLDCVTLLQVTGAAPSSVSRVSTLGSTAPTLAVGTRLSTARGRPPLLRTGMRGLLVSPPPQPQLVWSGHAPVAPVCTSKLGVHDCNAFGTDDLTGPSLHSNASHSTLSSARGYNGHQLLGQHSFLRHRSGLAKRLPMSWRGRVFCVCLPDSTEAVICACTDATSVYPSRSCKWGRGGLKTEAD